MRPLAEELHESLGQPIVVENAGGAFNIGARACAEARPRPNAGIIPVSR